LVSYQKKIVSVEKDELLTKTVSIMHKKDFSQIPVFSNSKCVGLISEHSISKFFLDNQGSLDTYTTRVEEIMDFPPPIIDSNYKMTPLLLEFLLEHDCLLVSENGKITLFIAKIDAIRGLMKK